MRHFDGLLQSRLRSHSLRQASQCDSLGDKRLRQKALASGFPETRDCISRGNFGFRITLLCDEDLSAGLVDLRNSDLISEL